MLWTFALLILSIRFWIFFYHATKNHKLIRDIGFGIAFAGAIWTFIEDPLGSLLVCGLSFLIVAVWFFGRGFYKKLREHIR